MWKRKKSSCLKTLELCSSAPTKTSDWLACTVSPLLSWKYVGSRTDRRRPKAEASAPCHCRLQKFWWNKQIGVMFPVFFVSSSASTVSGSIMIFPFPDSLVSLEEEIGLGIEWRERARWHSCLGLPGISESLPKCRAICLPAIACPCRKPHGTGRGSCLLLLGVAVVFHPVFEILWFTCKKHYYYS